MPKDEETNPTNTLGEADPMPSNDDPALNEANEDEETYVEYEVISYPSDYTLGNLVSFFEEKTIIIPKYQRKFVWEKKRASLLIESLLKGLPIPPLFFYQNAENQYEVIDGKQRLLSIFLYFKERFIDDPVDGDFVKAVESDADSKPFKLSGLAKNSPYYNKKFSELEEKHQRKLKSYTLRAVNVQQMKPDNNGDCVFEIFERLNSGGINLKPQEIRTAVYRGKIVEKLEELNKDKNWQKIYSSQRSVDHKEDVEMVLRLFSLYKNWTEYKPQMKKFLNDCMNNNRNFESEKAKEFEQNFPLVCQKVTEAFTEYFEPYGKFNSLVLESVMVALLENPDITVEKLKKNYDTLVKNDIYRSHVTSSTTQKDNVLGRNKLAKEILAR